MWISGLGQTVVAHVGGNLTASNRRELQQLVLEALDRGQRDVVVDLRDAGYVDGSALGTLVMLAGCARRRGGEFRLEHVNADVREVLALTQLDQVLPIATAEHGRAD